MMIELNKSEINIILEALKELYGLCGGVDIDALHMKISEFKED